MNILSIDFDYFQSVTKEQLRLYPDGIDNETSLSEIVWGSRYSENGKALREISIMQDKFNTIKRVLCEQDVDIPVMIANSHVRIYDFINTALSGDEELGICNVDMHHDILNENDNLDCGNWIGYILKERSSLGKKTMFKWVHNPISLSVYGIEEEMKAFEGKITSALKTIEHKKFDSVFLCRSDTWTPPHLDIYFSELCSLIEERFSNITLERGIDKPRTMYLEIEEAIGKAYKEIRSKSTVRN